MCEVRHLGFHLKSFEQGLYDKSDVAIGKAVSDADKDDSLDEDVSIPKNIFDRNDDDDDLKELVPA